MEKIRVEAEEKEGEKGWIMGRDFNARMRERGEMEEGDKRRKTKLKDKGVNKKGEELINWVEEEEWGIINGVKKGDEKGEIAFTEGRGGTVIDCVGR